MPKETRVNVFEKGMPPTIVPDEYPVKNYNLKKELEQEVFKKFEELGYHICQEKLDYWNEQNIEIHNFYNKYEVTNNE